MSPDYFPPLLNHLWQSTVFAGAAGLLTLALRKSRARTRYWLWLAASVKFLVPFSLLVDIGSHVEWRTVHAMAAPEWPFAMEKISRPFLAPLASTGGYSAAVPAVGRVLPALLFIAWACGFFVVLFFCWLRWRRIDILKRQAAPLELTVPIQVRSSSTLLEPAVFGVFRPVLLLPAGIMNRLTAAQLDAIVAHELCHVRYRDNLVAVLHILVEAIFWFHPLVWWLGARLVEERERACDEAVVQSCNDVQVYAEAILEVCKFYLESPLSCVAGVGGANLKRRIEAIMAVRVGRKVSLGGRLLLAGAGTLAVATPLLIGLVNAPPRQAKSSKAVVQASHSLGALSIKLGASRRPVAGFDDVSSVSLSPGNLAMNNASLRDFIQWAYRVRGFQLAGGPGWTDSHQYAIDAKASGNPTLDQWMEAIKPMLQGLLKDRFKLTFHYETRELPVYVLTVAKSGPKLERSREESCAAFPWSSYPPSLGHRPANDCGAVATGPNVRLNYTLDAVGMSIGGAASNPAMLTTFLSGQLGRPVIDKTGLKGLFDVHLEWNQAATAVRLTGKPVSLADPANPSIFTAARKQLGLKLELSNGPVEALVIDHAEKPILN